MDLDKKFAMSINHFVSVFGKKKGREKEDVNLLIQIFAYDL